MLLPDRYRHLCATQYWCRFEHVDSSNNGQSFRLVCATGIFSFCMIALMDNRYLDAHITGGYSFLMNNYRNGDKISIFGFSRGAYTARALAGMLTKVGLLPKDNIEQVPFAWKLYTQSSTGELAGKSVEDYRKMFSRTVEIEFLGIW